MILIYIKLYIYTIYIHIYTIYIIFVVVCVLLVLCFLTFLGVGLGFLKDVLRVGLRVYWRCFVVSKVFFFFPHVFQAHLIRKSGEIHERV